MLDRMERTVFARLKAGVVSFIDGTTKVYTPVWLYAAALYSTPMDIREQYEKQLKELQKAYDEAMLELRARKKLVSLPGEDDR